MKNLAFVGNSEPPGLLLEIFRKFTPGRSGEWGQLRGVGNYAEADYFAVIDGLSPNSGIDSTKCVFLGAHPPGMNPYRNMSQYSAIKTFDCAHTFGFGEWWLEYDYDYLTALKEPPPKTKQLACIMSNANTQPYQRMRKAYLARFCQRYGERINVYGRIIPFGAITPRYCGCCGNSDGRGAASGGPDHMIGKESVYETHKYAIEFDAPSKYYFSERIFDSLLLWCMPIYWGCDYLQEFIHHGAFSRLTTGREGDDVIDVLDSNVYERALPHIAETRNLLLNKLQIWPRVHEAIFGKPL